MPAARFGDRLSPGRLLGGPGRIILAAPGAPDDEDGAVGVPHHGVGDAAHEGPPDAAEAAAAHDHQPGVNLLGELDDLLVGAARAEVRLDDHTPGRAHALGPAVEEPPGLRTRLFQQEIIDVYSVGVV